MKFKYTNTLTGLTKEFEADSKAEAYNMLREYISKCIAWYNRELKNWREDSILDA